MTKFGIGQAITRREDQRLLTGQGKYIDDRKVGEWRSFDAKGRLVKTTRHKPQ